MEKPSRIVVAMSGGVDSSVAAALMKRQGHEVVGITLQLYPETAPKQKGACCAGQDIHDARRVAEALGIPHYVLDYQRRFAQKVIDDFADAYARGETPIPCVRCNERVKFADLMQAARELGADALATGHYVRRTVGQEGPELHTACDQSRDQSYFLFTTTKAQLEYLRFPVGGMEKAAVRRLAAELGLATAAKPDSQDICFVPSGRYSAIVEKRHPGRPGDIVDQAGNRLGTHRGIIHFTVGQRKGLGLSGRGEPLFVLKLDAAKAQVVVGPRQALIADGVLLGDVNWLLKADAPFDCAVKLRSMRPAVAARVVPLAERAARVELPSGEEAVAPGQACVFYDKGRVLGGGWIKSVSAVALPAG
ncbi:MAG: tRNA 2-thiouridine(34) synthase MnmA [Rhizomicrobium sp.]